MMYNDETMVTKAKAPIKTVPNPSGNGRPVVSEEQYAVWLEEMRPHLELSCSLWRAIEKSALTQHITTIYEKYRLGDWFAQKIDQIRAMVGENVNEALARRVKIILDNI